MKFLKNLKTYYLIVVTVITITIPISFWVYVFTNIERTRPKDVPVSAVWIGVKSGSWYEFVETNKNVHRIRVYHNITGELLVDADFKVSGVCKDNYSKEDLIREIIYFSDYEIHLKAPHKMECKLLPIKIHNKKIYENDEGQIFFKDKKLEKK